ncbi:hypothetical protein AAG570_010979 [Ranatra chinensis]|uniref:Palmitoyltransferase n=1 Tax=Ranatra chinensis TaxID=642074 RepID=A0ABD0YXN6_9HEMI
MATNTDFRPNSGFCGICVRVMKWVPVLFILCVVIWSYYVYVVQLCILTVEPYFEKIVYLLIYHVLFVIFMWSYWQTIFTPLGLVPKKFKLPNDEIEKLRRASTEHSRRMVIEAFAQNLTIYNRTENGGFRYCDKCQHIKPDRAHHCSVCGVCVLKMDHHCPWVNNCVSFTNYKFFVLFLGYSFLYCLFIVLTTLHYFILSWKHLQGEFEGSGRLHIIFLFFVAVMFAISLVCLFCYHCYLVSHNRSTLETFRAPIFMTGPDKNGFSLGKYNNFREVFGDQKSLWFLPIFSRYLFTSTFFSYLKVLKWYILYWIII